MKDHVPDLERCKRLKEKGFKGEVQFCWVRNEMKEWRVITVYECTWTELLDSPYYRVIRAPIVTELLGEIQRLLRSAGVWAERLHLICMEDGNWYAEPHYKDVLKLCDVHVAPTLPNALADLWIWLRERGE